MSTETTPDRHYDADEGTGTVEWRVTFTHFDYTGGANGLALNAPDNWPPGNDWQFESMTWLADGSKPDWDKVRRERGAHQSTALHGMLLILWKRERTDSPEPITPVEAKLAAYRDSTIREALRIAVTAAENDRQAERFEAALAAMDREEA